MPASGASRRAGESRQAWGWHPLDDLWAARIVEDAGVRPGELVLDIGAGHGALTSHLVKAGARVLAIELHPGRVSLLRERFARDNVTVVAADARGLLLPRKPFRVVANPPYALSSILLRTLLSRDSRLVAADLVLQRAFARRFAERWPQPSARWHVALGRQLPRRAFQPPPRVDSTVLIVRKQGS